MWVLPSWYCSWLASMSVVGPEVQRPWMHQLLWGSQFLRLQPVQCRAEKRLAGWCGICIASLSSYWAQFWEAKICLERDDLGSCKPYQRHKGCEMLWNMEVKLFSLSWAFLEMRPIGDYRFPFGSFSWSCREAAGFGILQWTLQAGCVGLATDFQLLLQKSFVVFQTTINARNGFPEAAETLCGSFESNRCLLVVRNALKPIYV